MSLMQHYDMVKESYKTIPSEFNGSEEETDVKTTESL